MPKLIENFDFSFDLIKNLSKITLNKTTKFSIIYLILVNLIIIPVCIIFFSSISTPLLLFIFIYFVIFLLIVSILIIQTKIFAETQRKLKDPILIGFMKIFLIVFVLNFNIILIRLIFPSDLPYLALLSNLLFTIVSINHLVLFFSMNQFFFRKIEICLYPLSLLITTHFTFFLFKKNYYEEFIKDIFLFQPLYLLLVLCFHQKINVIIRKINLEKKLLLLYFQNSYLENLEPSFFLQKKSIKLFDVNVNPKFELKSFFDEAKITNDSVKIALELASHCERNKNNDKEILNEIIHDYSLTKTNLNYQQSIKESARNIQIYSRNLYKNWEFSAIKKVPQSFINNDDIVIPEILNLNEKKIQLKSKNNLNVVNKINQSQTYTEQNNTLDLFYPTKSLFNKSVNDQHECDSFIQLLSDFSYNSVPVNVKNILIEIFQNSKKIDINTFIIELINKLDSTNLNHDKILYIGPLLFIKLVNKYHQVQFNVFLQINFIQIKEDNFCFAFVRNLDSLASSFENKKLKETSPISSKLTLNNNQINQTQKKVDTSKINDFTNQVVGRKRLSDFSKIENIESRKRGSQFSKENNSISNIKQFRSKFQNHTVINEEEEYSIPSKNINKNETNFNISQNSDSIVTKKIVQLDFIQPLNYSVNSEDASKKLNPVHDPQIAALFHDFKNVVLDFVSSVFFLINNLPIHLKEKFSVDFDNLQVLEEYIFFLIRMINNYVESNEFFSNEEGAKVEYDFIQLIELIVSLFTKRQEFDNSQNPTKLKNIKIHFKSQSINPILLEQASAHCDRDLFLSLLYNVISNAYKYTDSGEIKIEIIEDKVNSSLVISVSDTGNGIPDSILASWGKPFNLENKLKGSGLGQFIIEKLANRMKIKVKKPKSVRGKGTVFEFEIPLENSGNNNFLRKQITSRNDNTIKSLLKNSNKNSRSINILCLDDISTILSNVVNYIKNNFQLKNSIINVIKASSTFDVISEVNCLLKYSGVFDLLVFDVNIGEDLNGVQLAHMCFNLYKNLVRDFKKENFKIVFLTEENPDNFYNSHRSKYGHIVLRDQIFSKCELPKMLEKFKLLFPG